MATFPYGTTKKRDQLAPLFLRLSIPKISFRLYILFRKFGRVARSGKTNVALDLSVAQFYLIHKFCG